MKRYISTLVIIIVVVAIALMSINFILNNDFFSLKGFGDDTIFSKQNCNFEIVKSVSKDLVYRTSSYHAGIILRNIEKYKKHSGNLYILSTDGYAIVNLKENRCKVFYNDENLNYIKYALEYQEVYKMNALDEFTDSELEYLNKLKD